MAGWWNAGNRQPERVGD